ncbi:P-loop containing nucleoside triphosphate hydrolase protein [Auricularia subglabra TFB-10046 SS5]|nr:P-loop containing nucleoside triphosphate hydrolase protein [Auricularia subglabra TFB-10046 SS5]
MDLFKSLVTPFAGSSGLVDGMKLVVLGGAVETARRISSSAWSHFINSFFLTAHFSEEDYPFDWLMHWLAKQPAWQKSREFETTTRTTTVGLSPRSPGSGDEEDDQDDPEDELTPGKQKVKVVFQPTFDTTLTIFYKGHWLRVRRSKKTDGSDVEVLSISVVARSNTILKQLVLQAKREYEADAIHRIQIYFADSHGSWRWTDSRHKRPMSSIVLQPGVKEMLLADARDFLRSEKWYADRGIPFRRGFLLFGVPGSGKTSLIHAIAGELSLDIYVVSLSASWMTDSTLTTLMGRVPARCILLLEDLDAAFTRSVTRDSGSTGAPNKNNSNNSNGNNGNNNNSNNNGNNSNNNNGNGSDSISDLNTLSLSGLLNAIDGVAAAEGRLLFATTNHLERLDPALSRPGRMDVWVEFKNATKWQAEQLFRNFFPMDSPPSSSASSASSEADAEFTREEEEELVRAGVSALRFEATPLGADGRPTPATMMGTPAGGFVNASYPPSPPSSASPVVPPSPSRSARSQPLTEEEARHRMKALGAAYPPPPMLDYPAVPALDAQRLAELAAMFAAAIPDDEFSVAALQGYLLKNKSRPEAAAYEAAGWVQSERELRERLAREKEAKERRERERKAEERERRRREDEDRRREREEKERKEKEEKDKAAATTPTAAAAAAPVPEPTAAPAPAPAAAPEPAPAPAPVPAADVISVASTPAPGDADKENVWLRVMNEPSTAVPAPAPAAPPAKKPIPTNHHITPHSFPAARSCVFGRRETCTS